MSSGCFDVSKVFLSEKGPDLGLSTEEHEVRNQISRLSLSVAGLVQRHSFSDGQTDQKVLLQMGSGWHRAASWRRAVGCFFILKEAAFGCALLGLLHGSAGSNSVNGVGKTVNCGGFASCESFSYWSSSRYVCSHIPMSTDEHTHTH